MRLTQQMTDKIAISLSIICAVHCLLFPTILVLLPNFISNNENDKLLHLWMLFMVIPFSTLGLTSGLKNHKKYSIFFLGIFGIIILTLALLLNEEIFGFNAEKILTIFGTIFIATAHIKNYQLCKNLGCDCHSLFKKI